MLFRSTTSENGMKETRIDRIGEDKKSLTYFILWAIEAEAKGKQSVIEVRNQILLTNDTPYEVSTTPSATPVKVLAVIVAGVLGFFAVQSRQGTKRLKTSVTLRADSRNALPRTLTAENQSIRIFACESG